MLSRTKAALESFGVTFSGAREKEVHLIAQRAGVIRLETPCEFRAGRYAIGSVGAYTYLGGGVSNIRHVAKVGRYCSIAANVTAGQVEHPTRFVSAHGLFQGSWTSAWPSLAHFSRENAAMVEKSARIVEAEQADRFGRIEIGNDVWIGEGVFIRRGVRIGDGAIVGSRSLVVKDVPAYAVVGGVPARIIRFRFCDATIRRLLDIRWWDRAHGIFLGVDFSDIYQALGRMEENISSNRVGPLVCRTLLVSGDGSVIEEGAAPYKQQDRPE